MRHVKDILRLKHYNHLSVREVARSCGLPVSTVGIYLQRAEAAGLAWPLTEGLADSELQTKLLGGPVAQTGAPNKEVPLWPQIHEHLEQRQTANAVEQLYTIGKVASLLSVDDTFVQDLIKSGKLRQVKLDARTARIPASGLSKYLNAVSRSFP